ncbi:carcinoembryonic antigen-related cell adhesion molecule 20-like isoform X2 [Pimephales promelas]|uniref:carcinoembryonic antigen-related cell adhesion molecule 20-like isoform X2 n=1 Tax=Pimephales promelas TaxID=90988 RepID=UPI0019557989|nr:carcinoembryonic antigen-related cell adhesion molecule 20-like isoform X2 [Pimephales promelas]
MMVYYRLYWTLWMLSCFGQYLCQVLQFSAPANGEVGKSVKLAPDNPPSSTSIRRTEWSFTSNLIIAAESGVTKIYDAYKGRVEFDINTQSLELQNLTLGDSGKYGLRVTTNAEDILIGETSLQVFVCGFVLSLVYTEKVSNVRLIGPKELLIEGKSSANITSMGTDTVNSVEWIKDNSPLSPSNRIIFSPDNRSVSISPVQKSDNGEYQCTYRNPFSSETAKLPLIINYGPEDVSIKGPDVVDLGVSVSLSCSANSKPFASFSWRFNGTDTNVTTDTFTIAETDFTHSGDYECTASNNVTKRSNSQSHALLVKIGGGGGGGGGLTTGAIVGIVIGVLLAVSGICGLIVYLTKTKKIPMLNKEQKGKSSGAAPAQSRQEPEPSYEEIIDIQKTRRDGAVPVKRSESTVYENFSYEENEYENVKH